MHNQSCNKGGVVTKNKLTDKKNTPEMQEKIRALADQKNISMDKAREMLRKKLPSM